MQRTTIESIKSTLLRYRIGGTTIIIMLYTKEIFINLDLSFAIC